MATEHVTTHYGRADVGNRLVDDLRARVDFAALETMRRAPGLECERPLMQPHAADSKWVFNALAGAGDKPIERHRDLQAQLGHVRPYESGVVVGSGAEKCELARPLARRVVLPARSRERSKPTARTSRAREISPHRKAHAVS